MHRRIFVVGLASIGLLLASAHPAAALTKVRMPLPLFSEPTAFPGFCPFPVVEHDIQGAGTITLVFDAEDNLVRIDIHPHGVISEFSANGKTVRVNNSGPLSVFPQPDGTDLVFIRGSSFVADQGVLTGESFFDLTHGRVEVVSTFNSETGFNDFLSVAAAAPTTDLCALLAP
jgi:hypothetical protein